MEVELAHDFKCRSPPPLIIGRRSLSSRLFEMNGFSIFQIGILVSFESNIHENIPSNIPSNILNQSFEVSLYAFRTQYYTVFSCLEGGERHLDLQKTSSHISRATTNSLPSYMTSPLLNTPSKQTTSFSHSPLIHK